jgi:SAM-dependent methyltransferase
MLNVVFIWNFFRFLLEKTFKLYETRLALLEEIGINQYSRVLDFGCGTAEISKYFGDMYVGVENNQRFLESNRIKFRDKFFTDNLKSNEILTNQFDVVLLMDVVHHLDTSSLISVLKTLKEVKSRKKVIFDPILEQKNIFGKILVKLDRGKYIRNYENIIGSLNECDYLVEKVLFFSVGPTKCVMIVFT